MSKDYAYRPGRASGGASGRAKALGKTPDRSRRRPALHLVAPAARGSAGRAGAAPMATSHETRDDIVQALAHDVRNHAQAVSRSLELLLHRACGPLEARQAELLGASRDCLEMIVALAGDMDDLCRPDGGRPELAREWFDLVPLLAECVRRSRAAGADRGIRFAFTRGCAAAIVKGDRSRIARVVSNLLMNAARFSPSGGRVTTSCFRDDEEGIVVGVSDLGPGIPAGIRARVFDKAVRSPSRGESGRTSLGLGLAFCRRTIAAHGGRIWIESPLPGREHGACVRFTLPDHPGGRT